MAQNVLDLSRVSQCETEPNALRVGLIDKGIQLSRTATPAALLEPPHWVTDLVYFPRNTALLKAAHDCGCRMIVGSGMAIFQAVRTFKLFTNLDPAPARMRSTFEAFSTI